MSKKLQEKQRKRLADEARKAQQHRAARRSNLITVGLAVIVIGAVTLLIIQDRSDENGSGGPAPEGVAAGQAGCTEIEEAEEEGREHLDAGADVEYGTIPPSSGNHYGVQADPGFFPSALPEEQLVHNLEHGQVVIWYSPDAPEAVADDIEAYVESANADAAAPQAGPLLATPYEGLEGDATYGISAWTATQSCNEYSKEALDMFRRRFQGKGPEAVGIEPFEG